MGKSTWNGISLRRQILEREGILVPDDLGPGGAADVADVAVVGGILACVQLGDERPDPWPDHVHRLRVQLGGREEARHHLVVVSAHRGEVFAGGSKRVASTSLLKRMRPCTCRRTNPPLNTS